MRARKVRNGRVEHAMDLGYNLSPQAYVITREDGVMTTVTNESMELAASGLVHGDVFLHHGVAVRNWGNPEPVLFGEDNPEGKILRLCSREDTGDEGFVLLWPDALVSVLSRSPLYGLEA